MWEVETLSSLKAFNYKYFTSRKQGLLLAAATGGEMQPILTKDGAHEVTISPDESTLLVRYSYKNKPGIPLQQIKKTLY
jgi:hypothetical protein